MNHISADDLERFHHGMVQDEAELATIEEHRSAVEAVHYVDAIRLTQQCVGVAYEAVQYVDAIRGAIIRGDFDLE